MLGCGSSGEEPSISPEDADALNSRLDAIQEDADQKDCTGDSTVFTRLTATRDQIEASNGINDQGKSDLNELLDDLEAQIQEECDAAADSSSTTSSSTSTAEDTDTTSTTETTTEETTTTKETTESSTTEEPQEPATPEEPATPPESNPGNGPPSGVPPAGGGTGGESGGVGPGFESGRNLGG